MAKSQRDLNAQLKVKYMEQLETMLSDSGEEVLKTGNNELTIPVVDETGEEKFLQFVLKVPTGSRDGEAYGEAYDGYAMAEDYQLKLKEKAEKKKEAEEKKQRKIEKDKKRREEEKKRREAREGE